MQLDVVTIGENGVEEDHILVHDETNKVMAQMLADLKGPDFPEPLGVLYCNPTEPYEIGVYAQRNDVRKTLGSPDINALLRSGHTWNVER